MFDHYESFYRPRKSVWVRVAIAASVVAHVAAAAALIINAAWRIGKLQIQDPEISIAAFGLPAAAPPALAAEKRDRKKKPIRKIDDIVQKSDATENHDVSTGADQGTADGDPDGVGDSEGVTPGAPVGTLCKGSGCINLEIKPPAPKKTERPTTTNIPHERIKGHLISGETQIHPDTATETAINRSGKAKIQGTIYACISSAGRVVSAKVQNSTGYSAYDAKLLAGVRRWTYRPYEVNGTPIQVCTWINFIYRRSQ